MFKLRLTKGRSYTGYGVKATAESPCVDVEKKEVADALVAGGYFALIDGTAPASGSKDKPLEKMTEKELEVYAVENGIDLEGAGKKAEKLAKIQQALADKGDEPADNGGGLFGEDEE